MARKELDGEVSRLLQSVVDHFDNEDKPTRERQIRHYRRQKLYWNNFSQIYWSEYSQDYRIWNSDTENVDSDQSYYDRPVNVYQAFLQTIIAALSIQVPGVSCVPDDADNPDDLSTAKAGTMIGKLIYKHNDVIFLWLHALYIFCTEGMIACYNYEDSDKEYGTYKKRKFKNEDVEMHVCPECGTNLDENMFLEANAIKDKQKEKFQPDDQDSELDYLELEDDQLICPACAAELDPNLQKVKFSIPRLVGITDEPKSRICLEVYGGLYVKVANYAKKQCDTPYLFFLYETHYSTVLDMYPGLRDNMPQGGWSNIGVNDPYEQYGRLNPQYRGEYPLDNVTVRNCWLRKSSFNILPEEDYKKLCKQFPDGAKVVLVNDVCADYMNESLDDHWTLSHNPMSDYLTHDPLGELLTSIQDIVNDLISLTLQTIEHGILQTWVDPAVFNVPAQGQVEATPGMMTAVKTQGGNKNLSDSIYQSKAASLSPEVFAFYRIVQELGQFVSGALPSLFGGMQNNSGSQTASEYAMSKSSAMQRLNTPWKMMTLMWKNVFSKAIPQYMKIMIEDEKMVEKQNNGNYVNVFIRKTELQGKIGDYEVESSDQLPLTEEQQKEVVMKLIELNNQEVLTALMDPENLPFIRDIIRIPQFRLPGEDDRQKQYEEINELINSEPVQTPPDENAILEAQVTGQQPQPQEAPSVEVDPIVDNHLVEADICRGWLVSEAGRLAKKENPGGYKNVMLHMKEHLMFASQAMQQSAQVQNQQSEQPGQPDQNQRTPAKPKGKTGQIKENKDAIAPIK